ncbi:FimV/HubP family polar landmark protein [Thermithiobacillus tepidarius DSM 3134]|uniref:FimV/HubP family polar landmark protein n=1 Tax=Thermithiobacillus tepidarius TaxID=929 RepID=UPI000404D630|nr:FimV/HubP family polar landmark protein [Thermithiobacillus tepidarius]
MRKKWLGGALLGLGAMAPMAGWALGLGDISVLSRPGEPFRAQIPLRSVNPDQMADLQVHLASPSAFEIVGIPRTASLDALNLRIKPGPTPMVLVSSSRPLQEGTLRFLLELEWGGGKLVKEYVAAVDAPEGHRPAVVSLPAASTPVFVPQPAPAAAPRGNRPAVAPATPAQSWARVPAYGPITAKDNLYRIAARMRGDSSLSISRVMAALYQSNPGAFNAGNPDSLKPGAVLTAPPRSVVAAISEAEAGRILSNRVQSPGAAANAQAKQAAQPNGARAQPLPAAAKSAPSSQARMQPAAPSHPSAADKPALYITAPAASHAQANAASPELTEQLQSLQEANLANKKESELLAKSMASLSKQVQEQQRMLLELQNQSADAMAASVQSSLLKNPLMLLMLGSNALALLLVVWLLLRVRRTNEDVALTQAMLRTMEDEGLLRARAEPASMDTVQPITVASTPAPARESAAFAPAASSPAAPAAKPAPVPEAAEVDVLDQADLYLTYGRVQQAQEVLEAALTSQASRKEIYVKLLDLYAQQGKMDDYLDLAERMRGRFGKDNAAWRAVAAQGMMLFPDNPLFQDEAADTAAVETAAPQAAAALETAEPMLDLSLDGAQPQKAEEESNLMDFDFGGLSFDGSFASGGRAVTSPEPAAEEAAPELPAAALEQPELASAPEGMDLDFTLEQDNEALRDEVFAALDKEFRALEEAPEAVAPAAAADNVVSFDFSAFSAATATESAPADAPQEDQASAMEWDMLGTKLDLAKAYVDMGDSESAKELLEEVAQQGDGRLRAEAQELLAALG